jgi:hypothetical protein
MDASDKRGEEDTGRIGMSSSPTTPENGARGALEACMAGETQNVGHIDVLGLAPIGGVRTNYKRFAEDLLTAETTCNPSLHPA